MGQYKMKRTGKKMDDLLDKVESGNAGGGGGAAMINATYDELVALRNNSQLIPGQMYRMVDYDTYTSQVDTQSAMHPFDLILTALDNKTLSEQCCAVHSERDTEGYFAYSNMGAWRVWYCLDNDLSRFSWAVLKGITWRIEGISISLEDYGPYTWNGIEYYAYRFNMGKLEGAGMAIWIYALYPTSTPQIGDMAVYTITDLTPVGGSVQDTTAQMNAPITSCSLSNGKGVIYRLIDENLNDVCYDFKNILFIKQYSNGKPYSSYTFVDANGRGDGSLPSAFTQVKCNVIKSIFPNIPIIILSHEATGDTEVKMCNTFINCTEVYIYVSDGGTYNDNTFINCSLSRFGTQGGNYYINIEGCTITGCEGEVVLDEVKNKLIGCSIVNIKNATIEGCRYDNIRSLYIRQKTDGTVYSYTDEDIYNAINK